METIVNIASTAATAASKIIYGEQPAVGDEASGKEPLSGEQGEGTPTHPYDLGNLATPSTATEHKSTFLDYGNSKTAEGGPSSQENSSQAAQSSSTSNDSFLKLNPALDGPDVDATSQSSGEPKIYTNRDDATYTGMPIVPLNPNVATSGPGTTSSVPSFMGTSTIATKTGITDKPGKDTSLDDAPSTAVTVPESSLPASNTSSSNPTKGTSIQESIQTAAAPPSSHQDGTPTWTDTGVPSQTNPSSASPAHAIQGVEVPDEKHGRKSTTVESTGVPTSPDSEEKGGKMSHLKEKLKDKLHIGSKEK